MRFRIPTSRRSQLVAAAIAGTMLAAGHQCFAQSTGSAGANGATPTIAGPAPALGEVIGPAIIQAAPRVDTPAPNQAAATVQPSDPIGTFVADVSSHVRGDFANLTGDLRTAIDNTQGNAREKLIAINDRIAAISGNLVDRAKETKEQSRDRLGEVRNQLNEIRNDLTALHGSASEDIQPRIKLVRDRVDTLRDNLQSATESRFLGTLQNIRARAATAEEQARGAAANLQTRTRDVVGNLQDRAAAVQHRVQKVIVNAENLSDRLADKTTTQAAALSADAQRRAREDLDRVDVELSNLIAKVDETVRGRLESADEQLTSIREDLRRLDSDTPDQAQNHLAQARERLGELHTDLTNITSNASGNAKDELAKLRDTVGDAHDRLSMAGVANTVRHEAQQIGAAVDRRAMSSIEPGTATDVPQPGRLGVSVRQGSTGLTVTALAADSPAASAGLQVGDQLLAVNHRRIITHPQLVNELQAAAHADGHVVLTIRRQGRTQELQAQLGNAR